MLEEKVFTFNKQQEKLVGIKTVPQIKKTSLKSKLFPAIVLVHGFGVTKQEGGMFKDLARVLSSKGFLVFRFDFSGRGESEGNYTKTSLTKLADDLKSILTYIKKDPQVNKNKIGIHAQSFGTATTARLAPKINCLCLTGSISHPKKVMKNLFKTYNPQRISIKIMKKTKETIKMGPQFWQDLEKHKNLTEKINKFSCPVLFIHGEKDPSVPVSEMEAYFKNLQTEKKKVILKNADHGLRPKRTKMYQLASAWFQKYLLK